MNIARSPFPYLRRHRWLVAAVVAGSLVYVGAIDWFARHLEQNLAQTIKSVPVVEEHHAPGN